MEGLGKRFDSGWIIRELSLTLEKGDVLAVLGKNGCGKSTLLKMIAGLLPPSTGKVHRPNTIGYSALDGSLYSELSPVEHFELAAKLRKVEPRTDELLARIGLEYAKNRACGRLSSGMRTRVKLALAIQHQPELLILDEPAASLDEHGREFVRTIVEEQRERGVLLIATNEGFERSLATLELDLSPTP